MEYSHYALDWMIRTEAMSMLREKEEVKMVLLVCAKSSNRKNESIEDQYEYASLQWEMFLKLLYTLTFWIPKNEEKPIL